MLTPVPHKMSQISPVLNTMIANQTSSPVHRLPSIHPVYLKHLKPFTTLHYPAALPILSFSMFLRLGNICWHGNTSNTCRHPWRIQGMDGWDRKLREILRVGPVGSEDRHRCFSHVAMDGMRLRTSMFSCHGMATECSGAIHHHRDLDLLCFCIKNHQNHGQRESHHVTVCS